MSTSAPASPRVTLSPPKPPPTTTTRCSCLPTLPSVAIWSVMAPSRSACNYHSVQRKTCCSASCARTSLGLTPLGPPHVHTVRPPVPAQHTPHLVVGEVGEDLRHGEVPLRPRGDRGEQLAGELRDRALARLHHLADAVQPPLLVPRDGSGSARTVGERRTVARQHELRLQH